MEHIGSTFLSACAATREFVFFAKEVDDIAEQGTTNSTFFRYKASDAEAQFRRYDKSMGWPAVAMATIKPPGDIRVVIGVGPAGDFWEREPLSLKERVGRVASVGGHLRALGVVDNTIFACGMGRVALRRMSTGKWKSFGPKPTRHDAEVVGFNDIGGFGQNELYAVGWGGEIWWCDKGAWEQVDSPVSTNLTALTCSETGEVIVVGHDGVMLRGRHDTWQVIETNRDDNLRDVASHAGHIYIASDFEILTLRAEGLVGDDAFADPDDRPATCLCLLEAPDGVVSMGPKDVFMMRDGQWQRLV